MIGVVPATLQVTSTPAAAVLHAVRMGGPMTRDHITSTTGLSAATVNRQVHALAAHGLTPVVLAEKEGLALINGTDGMLAQLVLALADLESLLDAADPIRRTLAFSRIDAHPA